ncbi:MAG: hypothetical protein WCI77_03880 [Candidatus Omnitrophota bacterium]
MKNKLCKHYPLIISVCVLVFLVAVCLIFSVKKNQGHLIYALDDAYIHMAIAKNFVQHGVWGATKYDFNSSSSPILWLLLLSLDYFFFGVNVAAPFLLNIICAILVCVVSYVFLKKQKVHPLLVCIVLQGVIFFTPLPAMIFSGMEHTMHLLITIVFFSLAVEVLSKKDPDVIKSRLLFISAPLLTATRYESIFLVFVVCCLCVIKRRLWYALRLGCIGILPFILYGVISVSKGWYFVPTAFFLKCNWVTYFFSKGQSITFLHFFYDRIVSTPHILFFVVSILLMYIIRLNRFSGRMMIGEEKQLMAGIFLAITFLHMQFAGIGWYYRYEAYLVGLGILIIGVMLGEYFPGKFFSGKRKEVLLKCCVLGVFFFVFAKPLIFRGKTSLLQISTATHNIYEQQYQMGLFLNKFYQGESIAANDVGIINYLTDIRTLDLYGLISIEVIDAKLHRKYNTAMIRALVAQRKVKIVIVGDHWSIPRGGIPQEWVKVGQWKIPNNIACGNDTVSFYAVDLLEKDNLIKRLKLFSSSLPKDVQQAGLYTVVE